MTVTNVNATNTATNEDLRATGTAMHALEQIIPMSTAAAAGGPQRTFDFQHERMLAGERSAAVGRVRPLEQAMNELRTRTNG